MARITGIVIGIGILVAAFLAFRSSMAGWEAGHADLGFWWTVIAVFLAISGGSAVVGTWIHTRASRR